MAKEFIGELELNRIYQRDCIEGMRMLPDKSVDLIITSPPYNIGKSYETKSPIEDYIEWSVDYLKEIYRILKPCGNFMLQIGQYVDSNTNNIPLTYLLFNSLMEIGFKIRQEIIWYFRGGMPARKKLTGQNEKIMWLYKGDDLPFFDLDAIRVKEWQAFDKRNNPNGKNPTDVWEFNRVAGNSREKTSHPCQFPSVMIERIIKGWSTGDSIVFDPFIGSGTTAVAAVRTGRKFIGFEREQEYVEIANKRLDKEMEA
ncbi:site-specific DNA-methyltransferase [Heyndrickxia sporothermodurans]|uniref:DNA-methyltransferase n=1 Tax=Heyndrickxia sporothermodurans TaxID=46224 RepID=UPI002E1DDA0E|nr:site-specific DNA-methyltransferase [Heyndrickxia sporothermodurans]MED3697953.1 site-specific DNA-methyltransferase [Heyndrickxia sporothermodurans]